MKQALTRLRATFAIAAVFAGGFWAPATRADAQEIPSAPQYYVLDQPGILSAKAKRAIELALIEHDRVTGEQVVLAVFESLNGEELVDFTTRVFEQWKVGQAKKDNGILLALYWRDRKARLEVGYGLEPTLPDIKARAILEETLIPGLKAGDVDSAMIGATVEIMRVLESPLLQNGKLEEILRAGTTGGATGLATRSSGPRNNPVLIIILFALFVLVAVLGRVTRREAHYTRGGWYRTRASRRGILWGGGGGFGGGRIGGGFSGGGGRSGGGGASGSW